MSSTTLTTEPSAAPEPAAAGTAQRIAVGVYGIVAYALFFAVFLYLIAFVGGVLVPRHTGSGTAAPLALAIPVNIALVLLFGVQHAIMARPRFKAWITRFIPAAAERSTFVIAASLCLVALFAFWQPMPGPVWEFEHPVMRGLLWAAFGFGWALVLGSSFVISHFDLFGLRQSVLHMLSRTYEHIGFAVVGPYRLVRHPLMLGFLIAFWSAPTMSAGRLLFAAAMTAYILVGVSMEERDLIRTFGEHYRQYRRHVPSIIPNPLRRWKGL
ncbi:MAG: isoprenylcysteine carboxylmethyltransferase family protein [Phycisphaeraceae bacterium]|nr:isoprenylcysteine carboxylmethyltransferase family protein [Phycisphaeraceae bacterium]MCW5764217.1 isoprenylcysteine carboxylmethyltransferase family protein [Phycisphaeraceae bacterium]